MATRIEKEDPQNDDLVVLHPEQTVTINGQEITVREYGFIEGLKLRPLMKPLHDRLYEITQSGQRIELESILDVVADNPGELTQLIATSAGVNVSWINSLNDADGTLLMMTWWGVCGPFFVRKLSDRLMTAQLQRQAERNAIAGATFTPPSSPMATPLTK
jgi:hypothetical protein